MTRVRAMLELAERCEQAAGPDREIDAAIAAALHVKQLTHQSPEWIKDPEFTASLDAAMTLTGNDQSFWFLLKEAAKRCALATESNTEAEFRSRLPAFVSAAALRARAADTPKVTPNDC